MQPLMSIGRSIFRIVFLSGSPQRIQFSGRLQLIATLLFVLAAIASQRFLYGNGLIEAGLFLFTSLTGLYIASALLTRKVPRPRLRVTLLSVILILAASQLLLLLAAPLAQDREWLRMTISAAVGCAVLLGIHNCLRFALVTTRSSAILYTLLFAAAVAGFYAVMYALLEIVFS